MLRINLKLLVILLFLGSCAGTRQSCVLPAGILDQVASLKGLKKKTDVPCIQTRSTAELREILSETIDKRLSREQVELEGEILKLLGVIPKDYNYRENIISQYAMRLSAFYSPEFKRFVLAKDLGSEKKTVLAHELTHALQDQYYDLNALTAVTVPSDTVLARTSIFEGDANLTMHRFSEEAFCQGGSIKQAVEQLDQLKGEKSDIPLFFELQMAFPYLVGEEYLCQQIQDSRKVVGGGLNETLIKTYNKLPHSTSELLGFPDTKDVTNSDCLKSDSYGAVGIASLIANEVKFSVALKILSSLESDSLCLTRGENLKYKLNWQITLREDEKARLLKNLLSDYFSKHIPTLTYTINLKGKGLKIAIE